MGGLWLPRSERAAQDELERQREGKVECDRPANFYTQKCKKCKKKRIVHCNECLSPVTGCNCTLGKRVTAVKDELISRLHD